MIMRAITAVLFTACVLGTQIQQSESPSNDGISTNFKKTPPSNNFKTMGAISTRPEINTARRGSLTKRENIVLDLWTGP